MNNVIPFNGLTKCDLDAPTMLCNIAKESPKHAFVICWPEDGGMPTYHCTTGDMPVVLYRLQEFIHKELSGELTSI